MAALSFLVKRRIRVPGRDGSRAPNASGTQVPFFVRRSQWNVGVEPTQRTELVLLGILLLEAHGTKTRGLGVDVVGPGRRNQVCFVRHAAMHAHMFHGGSFQGK
jgi:hypothetical protein